MTKAKLTDAVFEGGDEYAIPLLARFESLGLADHLDLAIARFRFEDGVRVHVPISSLALDELLEALSLWRGKRVEAESKKKTKH